MAKTDNYLSLYSLISFMEYMRGKRAILKQAKSILLIILFSFFIVLFSFKTTVSFAKYTPQQQNAVDFLLEKKQPNDRPIELGGEYTLAEHAHMNDVQRLFKRGNALFLMLIGVMTFFLSVYHEKKAEMQKMILWSGVVLAGSVLLLSIIGLVSFTSVFNLFHAIFFPQGNWQFPVDSLLIQTFPLSFFTRMSFFIFLQAFSWGILFILLALYVSHADSKKHV